MRPVGRKRKPLALCQRRRFKQAKLGLGQPSFAKAPPDRRAPQRCPVMLCQIARDRMRGDVIAMRIEIGGGPDRLRIDDVCKGEQRLLARVGEIALATLPVEQSKRMNCGRTPRGEAR